MDQAQLEIELGAWKNIAIDKQVLLSDVFSVLGLSDQSSNDELKSTLRSIIEQASNASENILQAKSDVVAVNKQLSELKKEAEKVSEIKEKADETEEASKQLAINAKQLEKEAEEKVQASKKENAEDLKKINQQLKEKQKEIKAIHKILADSPENVVKKLKALNKEKFNESTLRKQAEAESRTLRKQLKEVEKDKSDLQGTIDKGADLVESVKGLSQVANELYTDLLTHVESADDVKKVPEIDEALLDLFTPEMEEA